MQISESNLQFRAATRSDVQIIVELVNSAYRGESSKQGWTTEADLLGGQRTDEQAILEIVNSANGILLLALQSSKLIGSVFLEKRPEQIAYLGMLTIAPNLQNAGLGRQLMQASEKYAREVWGAKEMQMTVITVREELLAWYERRGYQRTGKYVEFPYGDERFGLPKRPDLRMEILNKKLS